MTWACTQQVHAQWLLELGRGNNHQSATHNQQHSKKKWKTQREDKESTVSFSIACDYLLEAVDGTLVFQVVHDRALHSMPSIKLVEVIPEYIIEPLWNGETSTEEVSHRGDGAVSCG